MITPLVIAYCLNVQELVWLNAYPNWELNVLVHCHSSITYLSLAIGQALVQNRHALEILSQVVKTFQQLLTIRHLLTPNNPLIIHLKQLLKVTITLFYKEELMERAWQCYFGSLLL